MTGKDTIELIRTICRNRGIAISRLEKDCGFSNASISNAKDLTTDRLRKVAEYLKISAEYLLTGSPQDAEGIDGLLLSQILYDNELTEMLKKYMCLTDRQKAHVRELIEILTIK